MVGGSVDLCDRDGVTLTIVLPLAASTNPTGAPKDTYRVNEDVYAAGSGFTAGTNVNIHVVPDQDWDDGDQIPLDITGAVETASIVNGDVGRCSSGTPGSCPAGIITLIGLVLSG